MNEHLQTKASKRYAAVISLVKRECIRLAGGEFLHEFVRWEYRASRIESWRVLVFRDPQTGETLRMDSDAIVSVESVRRKLEEGRAKARCS